MSNEETKVRPFWLVSFISNQKIYTFWEHEAIIGHSCHSTPARKAWWELYDPREDFFRQTSRKTSTWPTPLQPSDAGGCGTHERHPSNRPTKTRWLKFAWTIDKKKILLSVRNPIRPSASFLSATWDRAPLVAHNNSFCILLYCRVSLWTNRREDLKDMCVAVLQQRFAAPRRRRTTRQLNETNKKKSVFSFCHKCFSFPGLHWFHLDGLEACYLDPRRNFEIIWDVVFLWAQASGHSHPFIELCKNQFRVTWTYFKQRLFYLSFKWRQKQFL